MPFLLLNDNPDRIYHKQQFEEVYRGFDSNTSLLGKVFFSSENIEIIQKQIILTVFRLSNTKIGYQLQEKILIVMRYVFTTYAKHLPNMIKEQIRELNQQVVDEVVPDIITNIDQNISYNKMINGEREFLERPIHVTHRESRPAYDFFIDMEQLGKP